jgi:hypothetical protein
MTSISILRISLIFSAVLVVTLYFFYPALSFPFGLEALECLLALLILVTTTFFIVKFRNKLSNNFSINNISFGLLIGLLWTIEIWVNNFIHPGLPYRDIFDDIIWGVIACLILCVAIGYSTKSKRIFDGVKSGLLTGLSSGAVACLAALMLVNFSMQLILEDPLNIQEWNVMKSKTHYPGMTVYFAYQTLAGAIMHLVVLGVIMGVLLGIIGGILGKFISSFTIKNCK